MRQSNFGGAPQPEGAAEVRSGPDVTRTRGLRFRKPPLYPPELRGRAHQQRPRFYPFPARRAAPALPRRGGRAPSSAAATPVRNVQGGRASTPRRRTPSEVSLGREAGDRSRRARQDGRGARAPGAREGSARRRLHGKRRAARAGERRARGGGEPACAARPARASSGGACLCPGRPRGRRGAGRSRGRSVAGRRHRRRRELVLGRFDPPGRAARASAACTSSTSGRAAASMVLATAPASWRAAPTRPSRASRRSCRSSPCPGGGSTPAAPARATSRSSSTTGSSSACSRPSARGSRSSRPTASGSRSPDVLRCWRNGSVIRSWLVDLLEAHFRDQGDLTRVPPYVEDTGEVNWLVADALRLEVADPGHRAVGHAAPRLARRREAPGRARSR